METYDFWSKLKKGDDIYLLIPIIYNDIYKYKYQKSYVINMKEYKSIYRLIFKYTDSNGKRIKVNLAINKNKYNLPYLPISRETEWARNLNIKYGDFIITTIADKLYLHSIIDKLIDNEINEYNNIIEKYTDIINSLKIIKKNNDL